MPPPTQFICILGPPGSGKGTHCAMLEQQFKCEHISIGDLLRAEASDPTSPYAQILQDNLRHGRIGTKEMTVGIVERKVKTLVAQGAHTIILDGFPRKLDTARYFEETVGEIKLIVVLACSTEVLEKRLLQRNRGDDDVETIRKRVKVYEGTTSVVVDKYFEEGKVEEVDSDDELHIVASNFLSVLRRNDVELKER